ncbi:MAG: class I SAM-dependent methyltransferase [Roseiflexaceae bacterium]
MLRHMPPQDYPSLLDLCCGPGRHALRLAAHGYHILGIDKNTQAIAHAQQHAVPHTQFLAHDMRDLHAISATFDGVLNLWHSFGYFDDATNQDILRQIHEKLRPGGRFILDIYNRASLERFPACREFEKEGVWVVTEYRWSGKRVTCTLTYDDGPLHDTFEWRIYTPEEIRELTAALGFRCLVACAWFNEQLAPSAEHARMQFLLERQG